MAKTVLSARDIVEKKTDRILGASKMVQRVKVLATKLDNMSSIPRPHMVEGKTQLLQIFLPPSPHTHTHSGTRAPDPHHTHTHIQVK